MSGTKSSRRVALVASKRPDPRGLAAAYLLIIGLIAASAGVVFGDFGGKTPQIVDSAVAASVPPRAGEDAVTTAPPPAEIQSLPLPRRPPKPSGFRTLPAAELAADGGNDRGRTSTAARLALGLDAVDCSCKTLRSGRPAAAPRSARDQCRRQRGRDAPRDRGSSARSQPGVPARHTRPASLAGAGPGVRPRELPDAAHGRSGGRRARRPADRSRRRRGRRTCDACAPRWREAKAMSDS